MLKKTDRGETEDGGGEGPGSGISLGWPVITHKYAALQYLAASDSWRKMPGQTSGAMDPVAECVPSSLTPPPPHCLGHP